jgi:hypothetical protein
MKSAFPLLVCLWSVGTAQAQVRPFVYTVTTAGAGNPSGVDTRPWAVYYDSGYGERTADPIGYDGVEQRLGVQGRPRPGLTLIGQMALGIGGDATRSSQEAELLGDVLGQTSRTRLAVGIGARHEWEGTTAALARVSLGWSGDRALVFGNLRLEKPFATGRDAIDLITTIGWSQRLGHGLRVGLEGVGEDIEGFWEAEEAEGGAKLYIGPAVHWSPPAGRLWLSASGGPILYATRSGRTSPAPRPLDASGNGFTVRLSVGYTF